MFSLSARVSIGLGVALLAPFNAAFAENIIVPKEHFSVEVRGAYGSQSATLFQDGHVWACQTESMPYSVVQGDPFADLDWGRLAKEAKRAASVCRDKVLIVDARNVPTRSIASCLTLPDTKRWVNRVNHECGR